MGMESNRRLYGSIGIVGERGYGMKLVYNIDFGITAAVFLVVLYTYVKLQYSSYSEVNRTFQKVVVITLIADVLDVLTAITISYGSQVPIFFNTVLNTLYYICVACMEFYFFLYFYLCVHGKHNSKSILFLVDQIGFVCYFIAVILNARFGYFFSFNEQGEYVHGVCYPLVFVVPYFFIVCALAVFIQGFQKFTFRQKVSIFVYLFTACMGPFLQLFVFPGVLLANFTLAVGIVMLLFSMETPDYQKLMETMTELDETRKEAEQAREEAIKASMAKSNFLANMSHEIRTPINSILGMDEMLLRESLTERQQSYAKNIESAGKSLLSIINDILDFSKIESGNMDIIPLEYELENLLRDCYNMVYMKACEKGLKLRVVGEERLPKRLYGDEVRVRQIITNILNNAVKYTEQGFVELSVNYRETGTEIIELQIQVKDSGIGIAPENKKYLFSSFERLEKERNRHIEGTGLGLAITKQLLDQMDGAVWVESEVGKGSTFFVALPQTVVSREPIGDFFSHIQNYTVEKEEYKECFQAPDAKVLVVDDVMMNLQVVKGLLRDTKVQVTLAKSGAEALELAEKERYDLILMDHMMPEMDGIETLQKIREGSTSNKQTPIVVLTANAIAGEKEKYLAAGFVDYLSKPVRGKELEKMVMKYLPQKLIK